VDGAGRVAGYGDLLEHRDAAGIWWPIDWTTGQVVQDLKSTRSVASAYATSDCTGTRYLYRSGQSLGPPRTPLWSAYEGQAPGGVWRTRADASQMTRADLLSQDDITGCISLAAANALVLRFSDAPAISGPPILPTSGPLRREVQ
jgi:hypothetical protein